ncbi:hypothetical protein HFP05_18330 [Rhodanobacter denitrificans]|nr:hypothetical protein [Rhodanobacter denitrificans]
MLKAYYCDDMDLYAAESAEQAAQVYEEHTNDRPDEGYPRELTDAELDAPQPEFDENEERTGGTTSIRQMLAEHGDEPGWLAGRDG